MNIGEYRTQVTARRSLPASEPGRQARRAAGVSAKYHRAGAERIRGSFRGEPGRQARPAPVGEVPPRGRGAHPGGSSRGCPPRASTVGEVPPRGRGAHPGGSRGLPPGDTVRETTARERIRGVGEYPPQAVGEVLTTGERSGGLARRGRPCRRVTTARARSASGGFRGVAPRANTASGGPGVVPRKTAPRGILSSVRRGRRRSRRLGRTVNLAGAALISAVLLWVMAAGFGTVPPLGAVLDAGRGAWTSAAGGRPVTSQTLRLPGLQHPVSVTYTPQGIASVRASTDYDAFLALGYVHASFRLAEMDEERRLGEGRLAQLAAPPTCRPTSSSCASAWYAPRSGNGPTLPGPARPARRCWPTPRVLTLVSRGSARTATGRPPSRWPASTRDRGLRWTRWSSRAC